MITTDQVTGATRWGMGVISGAMIARGFGSAEMWVGITGVAASMAPLVWGLISNRANGIIQSATKLQDVKAVVTSRETAEVNMAFNPKVVSKLKDVLDNAP